MLIFVSLAVGYFAISGSLLKSDKPAFAAPITGISVPAVASNASFVNTTVVRSSAMPLTKRPELPRQEQEPELQALALVQPSPTPTQASAETQEDPLARQAVVAEATPVILPLYQVWEAQDGDSVYSIAERFGILPDYILANNVELAASDFISIGQSIIIPAGNGVLHDIKYGETLSDISARYDVPVEEIVGFGPNNIADANSVVEAQTIFVPNATIIPAAPFEEIPVDEGDTGDGDVIDDGAGEAVPDDPGIVGGGPSSSAGLIWPLSGPISSYYGPSHPLGIDIDGFNLVGSAIGAATEGTVVFAGGNACCSYGLYVVVVSPGGIETLYAHLSSIYVTQGEYVSQGQALGVIGNSGYSTGVHLHFEVIDNGVRQNPLNYLP